MTGGWAGLPNRIWLIKTASIFLSLLRDSSMERHCLILKIVDMDSVVDCPSPIANCLVLLLEDLTYSTAHFLIAVLLRSGGF